jgi:hypothetical protein
LNYSVRKIREVRKRAFFVKLIKRKMNNEEENEKGKITPEKALKMLNAEGLDLSLEQAKEVLEFLRKLANIAVSKYLRRRE